MSPTMEHGHTWLFMTVQLYMAMLNRYIAHKWSLHQVAGRYTAGTVSHKPHWSPCSGGCTARVGDVTIAGCTAISRLLEDCRLSPLIQLLVHR